MNNSEIADSLSLLAKLIDIHGDDSFKAKSYSVAAFTIDKLPVQLSSLSEGEIFAIKGIGSSTGKKILEMMKSGSLPILTEYIAKTPGGVLDLMKIKGLGPKKISVIWKELGIENIGELLYSCEENRLLLYKGFGAKTQQNIKDSIDFYLASQGSYLYRQIEDFAHEYTQKLLTDFPGYQFVLTGDVNRHMEVIYKLEWITDAPIQTIRDYYTKEDYETTVNDTVLSARGPENLLFEFEQAEKDLVISKAFRKNCSLEFFELWQQKSKWDENKHFTSEEEIFVSNNATFIPPFYRETSLAVEQSISNNSPAFIQPEDIRGIIHSHSDWSDGKNTIEQMAAGAIAKGLEYLVISDHSQTASYAGGLYPDRIKAQHALIDELNEKYRPFKIFKSIESDILNDGSLDYSENILSTFDLVITSVHANLKMNKEKAMMRLLKAVSNPFTTILGHMTGRLLLSRNGYPVDYDEIIDACAKHNVVIELNAHSRRLDMDWRYIPKAVERGVLISIDPDAHTVDAFADIKYGVIAAQKGGLTAKQNLSSFTLAEFESFLLKQKEKR